MKKVMMTLLMIAAFSVNGFAQKGMNGIGINVPVGVYDATISVLSRLLNTSRCIRKRKLGTLTTMIT